jgi:hypothetical protein
MIRTLMIAGLAALTTGVGPAAAQIPGLGEAGRLLDRVPSLSSFLEGDPPITTSLDDARTEIAFLDGYSPTAWTRMDVLPRTSRGAFQLRSGRYALEAQSYCMHAGTHGPGGGDGYLYAPLAGPKAPIVRSILRNSVAHPEIPQRDIQVLIWAIIARTEFDEMPREMQQTARTLLSRDQIKDLDKGALGPVPESVMREAMNRLPPLARQVFEAEARLRSMISSGTSSFAELERVAVLTGAAPPTADSRPVPEQRWSYHPDGFFVRYNPQGYSHTRIEVVVPRPVTIARDAQGRIVTVVEGSGRKIEVEYDDASAEVVGDAGVRAFGLRSVRSTEPGDEAEAVVGGSGWTLVGVPRGGGRAAGAGRFADLAARYRAAEAWRDEVRALAGRRAAGSGLADALDLAQLHLAIEDASGGAAAPGGWEEISAAAETALLSLAEAWQSAVCASTGCPSVSAATDVLVLRNGEVRRGDLFGCGGETCWFEGSGVSFESIAWIGLATSGLPPSAQNPDVDEVHLDAGPVRPGELLSVSEGFVWTGQGGYDRPAVEWIHLAGSEETPPAEGPSAGGPAGAPQEEPARDEEDEDEDDEDGGRDEDDGFTFDPSGDVATPGNRARQRLATSGRPSANGGDEAGPDDDCTDPENCPPCETALRNYEEAQELQDRYRDQHATAESCGENCTQISWDDEEERSEYWRLAEITDEAIARLHECWDAHNMP